MSSTMGAEAHYSLFSRTVHWLTVILMAGMLYTGFTGFGGPPPGGMRPGGAPGGAMTMSMQGAPGAPGAGPQAGGPGGAPGGAPAMTMQGAPGGGMAMQGMRMGGPPGGMREQSAFSKTALHKAMGFTILLLAIARLIYRFACKVPALPADLPAWQAFIARGVQVLIYILLFTQPLSGWLGGGRAFTYFGIFTMPPVTFLTSYGQPLRWVHQNGAWALIWLISLHTLGALYHHYVRKDKVLLSMLRGA